MKNEKKTWVHPELMVLVKNRPEETVLTGCKVFPNPGGVDAIVTMCGIPDCSPCFDWSLGGS